MLEKFLEDLDQIKKKNSDLVSQLNNFTKISANIIDNITVRTDHGSMKINHIASITADTKGRRIFIVPFDQNNIKNIESELVKANLGSVTRQDNDIILNLKAITKEDLNDLHKKFKKSFEDLKIQVRNLRHNEFKKIDKDVSSKDQQKILKDQIEKHVKDINTLIDNSIKNNIK